MMSSKIISCDPSRMAPSPQKGMLSPVGDDAGRTNGVERRRVLPVEKAMFSLGVKFSAFKFVLASAIMVLFFGDVHIGGGEGPLQSLFAEGAFVDVCTADEYRTDINELCGPTFLVSSVAYNPHASGVLSTLTMIIQPSKDQDVSAINSRVKLRLTFPGFRVPSTYPEESGVANSRQVEVFAANEVAAGADPSTSYNSQANPVFEKDLTYFNSDTESFDLIVADGKSLAYDEPTTILICCFILPTTLEPNPPTFLISSEKNGERVEGTHIPPQQVKSVPEISLDNYWAHIEVNFDPALPDMLSVISVKVRTGETLTDRAKVVVHLPMLKRNRYSEKWAETLALLSESLSDVPAEDEDLSGIISYTTPGNEWMLFDYDAEWNDPERTITFTLREGAELRNNQTVTLKTMPDEFYLPSEIIADDPQITVRAISNDMLDVLLEPQSVMQSDRVPHVLTFTDSQLAYTNQIQVINDINNINSNKRVYADVQLQFMTNSPLWSGNRVFLRLSGFQADQTEIPILGDYRSYFQSEIGNFDLPNNVITLILTQTLYSNRHMVSITLQELELPSALYENDISLKIWNQDYDCVDVNTERCNQQASGLNAQSIGTSPEFVGSGSTRKMFSRSEIEFTPKTPSTIANITFTITPSVTFYQGDAVLLYLNGFSCQSCPARVDLYGPDMDRFTSAQADWTPETSTLTLEVAPGSILRENEVCIFGLNPSVGFRLPDKLSQNDGILNIEGRGAYIERESIKVTPQLGTAKEIVSSVMRFESTHVDGALSLQIAKITFEFMANTEILANSTIVITMPFTREIPNAPDDEGEGYVQLSGPNAPLFQDGKAYWLPSTGELSCTVIQGITIEAQTKVEFFLEIDQYFKLPYALGTVDTLNDPSLMISVPSAGLAQTAFQETTKVNNVFKEFDVSELMYGTATDNVANPGRVMDLTFRFSANTEMREGTQIVFTLPGFVSPNALPHITAPFTSGTPDTAYQLFKKGCCTGDNNDQDYWYGSWDQTQNTFMIELQLGNHIAPETTIEIRIPSTTEGSFQLPNSLQANSTSLKIETINRNIIAQQPIAKSPRVINRQFSHSQFSYNPAIKDSTFLFTITLTPSVDVYPENILTIRLPGFRNIRCDANFDQSLSACTGMRSNIHLTGDSAYMINSGNQDGKSIAIWNQETSVLQIRIADEYVLTQDTTLTLKIQESQGFILPESLLNNDPSLTIDSLDNIDTESVKISPMVGGGPSEQQYFCLYQYRANTPTIGDPQCSGGCDSTTSTSPMYDPCDRNELIRCSCDTNMAEKVEDYTAIKVRGFELMDSDKIGFVPIDENCPEVDEDFVTYIDEVSPTLDTTSAPSLTPVDVSDFPDIPLYTYDPFAKMYDFKRPSKILLSQDKTEMSFYDVVALKSGYYRICFLHLQQMTDIGRVIAKTTCPEGMAAVDGVCVSHCPGGHVPIAGTCEGTDNGNVNYTDPTPYILMSALERKDYSYDIVPFSENNGTENITVETYTTSSEQLLSEILNPEASSVTEDLINYELVYSVDDPNMVVSTLELTNPYEKIWELTTSSTETTTFSYSKNIGVMVGIEMRNPDAIRSEVYQRSTDDPERQYFEYRFKYELSILLDCQIERLEVSSISSGEDSVIVNTVFLQNPNIFEQYSSAAITSTDALIYSKTGDERTSLEMLLLLQALQHDSTSNLHSNDFFTHFNTDQVLAGIEVNLCDADDRYRNLCYTTMNPVTSWADGGGFIAILVLSHLLLILTFVALCMLAWRLDFDSKTDAKKDAKFFASAAKTSPSKMDPALQKEYARSWLSGRYMGDAI